MVEEKGLRELVELYGEKLADADWRYQEFLVLQRRV